MASAGEVYIDVTARITKAEAQIKQLQKRLLDASKKVSGATGNAATKANKALTGFSGSLEKLRLNLSHFNSSVWNVYTSIKDVFRVATGILMSQFIYRGILTPIRESISSLWEFNQLLETTHISLEYFLEDSKNIKAFSDAMEDMAARTPYQFRDVASAA
ncbi:MAG: hypothetical protein ACTSPI_04180, partial [Candidatus Heimdallarchaeaceae archaeon]